MRVMTILGTRPEIIRLSGVMKRLDEVVDHVIVHTGQNYDYSLNQVFFEELGVRRPDHFLEVDASSLGTVYGNVLIGAERVLASEQPDAVLVLGDTNSAIAAIMAKRMHVPVYHMEAGNRSFDENVPEEINRRLVDHIADFNLVYTERARQHLLAEGLDHRRIYLTGSPLTEVYAHHRDKIARSDVLERRGLHEGEFVLASVHREENVDDPDRLTRVLTCLEAVQRSLDCKVVVSTHPRTRKRLDDLAETPADSLEFAQPFGYLDYNHLQQSARCVISDSGSIAEESAIIGFPAVTLRDSMERPEALDAGLLVMTGLDSAVVVDAVRWQIERWEHRPPSVPEEYRIEDASDRVVSLILGTAGLSNRWHGVREDDRGT